MQHTPHLSQTLENLLRGRLRDTNFPFLDSVGPNAGLQRSDNSWDIIRVSLLIMHVRPQDVIIFMVGGTTYEEARTVSLLNQESSTNGSYAAGTRFLLGGTCVHNSSR